MSSSNPYQSPQTPGPFADRQAPSAEVQAEAKRLMKEKQDSTTSWQLLATGILGCFSPILAIYGIIFLLRRPHSFPLKGLAIAGTILHCVWTALLILMVVVNIAAGPQHR